MVTPQWGSFQKPIQSLEKDELQEDIQEIPGEVKDQEKPQGKKPQWGDFQTPSTYQGEEDATADEGFFEYIGRNIVTNNSRLNEQILGRPGNIEKFVKESLSEPKGKVDQAILGGLIDWFGKDKWERMIKGPPGRQQLLPTSENLKEFSEKATGGLTKPKTEGEEKFQKYTESVGQAFSGRAPTWMNNFVTPVVSNAIGQVVEDTGFGKDKANMAKMALWTSLTLANNVNAPQHASRMMNEGREGIPQNVNVDVVRMQNRLHQLQRDPQILNADPRSALARQEIVAIERDLANGQVGVGSFMNTYDGVNAVKRNRDMFSLSRNDQNYAKRQIDKVRNAVRDEIMHSASQYPEALNNWRNGIQAWAVIHRSNALTNWIEGLARGPYGKAIAGPAAGLFGVGAYGVSKVPIVAGSSSIALPASYKTAQTMYRMWQDPNLRNYYFRAIGSAINEDSRAFISEYQKLNDRLEKSESTKKNARTNK